MTVTKGAKRRGRDVSPGFNDFRKSKGNAEPPEKNLGLDWDAIKTAYEARLDWEESQGLEPIERRGRNRTEIPESEKPQPVKQSVKRAPKPKKDPEAKPDPGGWNTSRPKADRGRIAKLHKQGLSATAIGKELGFDRRTISSILRNELGVPKQHPKDPQEKCQAGLHDMSEFGVQRVRIRNGVEVKDGRYCKECKRLRELSRRRSA